MESYVSYGRPRHKVSFTDNYAGKWLYVLKPQIRLFMVSFPTKFQFIEKVHLVDENSENGYFRKLIHNTIAL